MPITSTWLEDGIAYTQECWVAGLWLASSLAECTILPKQFGAVSVWQGSQTPCKGARSDHSKFWVRRFCVQSKLETVDQPRHCVTIRLLCWEWCLQWWFPWHLVAVWHNFSTGMVDAPQKTNDLLPELSYFTSHCESKRRVFRQLWTCLVGKSSLAFTDPWQNWISNSKQLNQSRSAYMFIQKLERSCGSLSITTLTTTLCRATFSTGTFGHRQIFVRRKEHRPARVRGMQATVRFYWRVIRGIENFGICNGTTWLWGPKISLWLAIESGSQPGFLFILALTLQLHNDER